MTILIGQRERWGLGFKRANLQCVLCTLRVYIYICIYIYIYMCIYIYIYIYICICLCIYIYVYLCIRTYEHPCHAHRAFVFACRTLLSPSEHSTASTEQDRAWKCKDVQIYAAKITRKIRVLLIHSRVWHSRGRENRIVKTKCRISMFVLYRAPATQTGGGSFFISFEESRCYLWAYTLVCHTVLYLLSRTCMMAGDLPPSHHRVCVYVCVYYCGCFEIVCGSCSEYA